jgi:hypothetical protein
VGGIGTGAFVVVDDEHALDGPAIDFRDPQFSPAINGNAGERQQSERKCDRERPPPNHSLQIVTVVRAVGTGVGTL